MKIAPLCLVLALISPVAALRGRNKVVRRTQDVEEPAVVEEPAPVVEEPVVEEPAPVAEEPATLVLAPPII